MINYSKVFCFGEFIRTLQMHPRVAEDPLLVGEFQQFFNKKLTHDPDMDHLWESIHCVSNTIPLDEIKLKLIHNLFLMKNVFTVLASQWASEAFYINPMTF